MSASCAPPDPRDRALRLGPRGLRPADQGQQSPLAAAIHAPGSLVPRPAAGPALGRAHVSAADRAACESDSSRGLRSQNSRGLPDLARRLVHRGAARSAKPPSRSPSARPLGAFAQASPRLDPRGEPLGRVELADQAAAALLEPGQRLAHPARALGAATSFSSWRRSRRESLGRGPLDPLGDDRGRRSRPAGGVERLGEALGDRVTRPAGQRAAAPPRARVDLGPRPRPSATCARRPAAGRCRARASARDLAQAAV